MDKILAPIKQRLLQYIEKQRVGKIIFFKNLGLSASNFRGSALYSEIGGDVIAKILSHDPKLNPRWLILGEGYMFNEEKIDLKETVNIDDEEKISLLEKIVELQRYKIDNLEKAPLQEFLITS